MSKRNSDFARKARDHYPTPPAPLDALLGSTYRLPSGVVYEACPGRSGQLGQLLEARGYQVRQAAYGADFRELRKLPAKVTTILTNPPFKVAGQIIRHALDLMAAADRPLDLVLLLPTDFDHAAGRADLFRHPCFTGQIKLNRRIVWFRPKPPKKPHPSEWHSWFIWSAPPRQFLPWVRYATWE